MDLILALNFYFYYESGREDMIFWIFFEIFQKYDFKVFLDFRD